MYHQHGDRRLLWAMLALLVILCISFTTQTPQTLVIFAGFMVIIGILGWYYSSGLPYPWLTRLVSTLILALGIAFLIWYFNIGRTLLHPIIDMQSIFRSISNSLVTPTP